MKIYAPTPSDTKAMIEDLVEEGLTDKPKVEGFTKDEITEQNSKWKD